MMIDLHTHVLPGIDDGARSLDEAVEMCRLAALDGAVALVATPHQRRGSWWNADVELLEEIRLRVEATLAARTDPQGPVLRILSGGEIHVDPRFLGEFLLAPSAAIGVLPLAGSRYLLLELDVDSTPREAFDLVHELSVEGWRPILAHPEFIPCLAEDVEVVARLAGLGAHFQVTAMSITGDFGRRTQTDVFRFLDAGLVDFVASDCHGSTRRPPGLSKARAVVANRHGESLARLLFEHNPRAVIENRTLPTNDDSASAEPSATRAFSMEIR
jgi:protein-tyrosine phosphatase